jgi:hypothetical protein
MDCKGAGSALASVGGCGRQRREFGPDGTRRRRLSPLRAKREWYARWRSIRFSCRFGQCHRAEVEIPAVFGNSALVKERGATAGIAS